MVDNADTDDKSNKKSRQINGLINEWYLEDLSENVRRTLAHKKQKGEFTGSFAPYGYVINPLNKNHLVVDPVAAKIVQEIFAMYKSGCGYVTIAKTLNSRGVLNPSLYKRAQGSKLQTNNTQLTSSVWTDSTIYNLIRREVYLGHLVQGRSRKASYKSDKKILVPESEWIRVENTHEPIIDQETWDAIELIKKTQHRCEKFTGRRHALSGKVYCGVCGTKMWKMSYACADGRYKYFKCKTVKNTDDLCKNNRSIRADNLSEFLVGAVSNLIYRFHNPDEFPEMDYEMRQIERSKVLASEKYESEQLLATLENQIQTLYRDRLSGTIADAVFEMVNKQLNKEYQDARDKLARIVEELAEIDRPADTINKENLFVKYTTQVSEISAEVATDFIDRIYVGLLHDLEDHRDIEVVWSLNHPAQSKLVSQLIYPGHRVLETYFTLDTGLYKYP